MALFVGAEVSGTQNSSNETTDSITDVIKNGTTKSNTTGTNTATTTNNTAGSVNTSDILTTGTQSNSGSKNTSISSTAGSVNTLVHGGSTSVTKNSGRTDTTQLLLTQDAVDYMVKGILDNTNTGLAQITSGKNIAGVYNDTSTTFLANDLVARTAGEVAARGAITQTIIGESSSTTSNSGSTDTQNIGATSSNTAQTIGASTIDTSNSQKGTQNIGATSSTGTSVTNISQDTTGSSSDSANSKTRTEVDSSKNETKESAKGGWIICTELRAQNKMKKTHYAMGLKVFDSYNDKDKCGYYIWAIPCVRHLRAKPHSLRSKILELVFNARASHITAGDYPSHGEKSILGFISTHGLFAFSWILAKTIAKNYIPKSPEEAELYSLKGVPPHG